MGAQRPPPLSLSEARKKTMIDNREYNNNNDMDGGKSCKLQNERRL